MKLLLQCLAVFFGVLWILTALDNLVHAQSPADQVKTVDSLTRQPVSITPSDSVTFAPSPIGIRIIVTAAGNVKIGFANGVTMTLVLPTTGVYQFPDAANQVFVTGTTATFTAFAL